jgi:hypothetical protein
MVLVLEHGVLSRHKMEPVVIVEREQLPGVPRVREFVCQNDLTPEPEDRADHKSLQRFCQILEVAVEPLL